MKEMLNPETVLKGLKRKTVTDFWSWAFSDILSNAMRGVFAEFIVGCALDALDRPRVEWDAYDLTYKGKGIEVKSAAYIQSWLQERPSHIGFDTGLKLGWNAETNITATVPGRSADCYVFCLFNETNKSKADVLDVSQWEFYVLGTKVLNQVLEGQKSISLKPLRKLCAPVGFDGIKEQVDKALGV